MFSLVSGLYDSYLAPTQLNILVVGAPSVGKTSLLERLKVTQIPKKPRNNDPQVPRELTVALQQAFRQGGATSPKAETTADSPISTTKESPLLAASPKPTVMTQKRRFPMICPAPQRYSKTEQDQEEVFVLDDEAPPQQALEDSAPEPPLETPSSPQAPQLVRCHSKELTFDQFDVTDDGDDLPARGDAHRNNSLESIQLDSPAAPPLKPSKNDSAPPLVQSNFEEMYRKPNTKMLPMSKIRPTIGTNLGKLDMYGAKCHLFDVGGRLQALWERYYEDCDAVIFCWKLGDDDPDDSDVESDSDSEEENPLDISKQQETLLQVRQSIPDDIPFLVFGHIFGNANCEVVDKLYSTDLILPHYHNPMTVLFCGSAKTGAGIPSAMEWLIPIAKRQQRERLAARKQLEEKLVED